VFFVFKICQPFALKNLPIAILFFPTQELLLEGARVAVSQEVSYNNFVKISNDKVDEERCSCQ
jgi:hypothetical protein